VFSSCRRIFEQQQKWNFTNRSWADEGDPSVCFCSLCRACFRYTTSRIQFARATTLPTANSSRKASAKICFILDRIVGELGEAALNDKQPFFTLGLTVDLSVLEMQFGGGGTKRHVLLLLQILLLLLAYRARVRSSMNRYHVERLITCHTIIFQNIKVIWRIIVTTKCYGKK
jgi:hypothetical protein